jgi:membrane protease subunit HflK
MYLETMEHVLSGTDKTIIDTGAQGPGVVPYLPLNEIGKSPPAAVGPSTGVKP